MGGPVKAAPHGTHGSERRAPRVRPGICAVAWLVRKQHASGWLFTVAAFVAGAMLASSVLLFFQTPAQACQEKALNAVEPRSEVRHLVSMDSMSAMQGAPWLHP